MITSVKEIMEKATARPWHDAPAGGLMADTYSQPYGIIQYNKLNLIAGCFGDVCGGKEVAEANAALIVRAVNNFEATQRILKALNGWLDGRKIQASSKLVPDKDEALEYAVIAALDLTKRQ